jgi:ferredoxin
VDCIHPTPDEPDYEQVDQLYIDPEECIDCDACVEACPVDAITSEDQVPEEWQRFIELNADFYRNKPHEDPLLDSTTSKRSCGPSVPTVMCAGTTRQRSQRSPHQLVSRRDGLPTPGERAVIERALADATRRRRVTILRRLDYSSGREHPRLAAGDHATA